MGLEDGVTREERAMLTFAVQWAPFGAGDEFILPEFGITPGAFYHRLRAILFSATGQRLGPRTTQQLLSLCATKVGPVSPP